MNRADISQFTDPKQFLEDALAAAEDSDLDSLLSQLPIVAPDDFRYDPKEPENGWTEGQFHWVPVGLGGGNMGRIQLAPNPINPIVERTVNGMEALIELERERELRADPAAPAPASPREAIERYFGLPRLDQLDSRSQKDLYERAKQLADRVRINIARQKKTKDFTLRIEDDGIGQPPDAIHQTLLSLSESTKDDKPYLIGLFGQGGSSTYAMSNKRSMLLSRRPADLVDRERDGVGWSVIMHHIPRGRRASVYLYIAATPDGAVPRLPSKVADELGFTGGTRFVHYGYDFGSMKSAVTRSAYQMLNHALYNPVLPYMLETQQGRPDRMWGNSYLLARLNRQGKLDTDLTIDKQPVALG